MHTRTSPGSPAAIWTIGHSTREWDAFTGLLGREGIEQLADVRAFPGSRRHPQFDRERMAAALPSLGIEYRHCPALGGRRRAPKDAEPTGWRNASFHAYATYMRSPEFAVALDELITLAGDRRTAIMCSEAVPWRCHRNLIADALVARGIEVLHIGDSGTSRHVLTPFAHIDGGRVRYPAPAADDAQQLDLPV